mgnify:CR=1 FL=1
MKTRIPFLTATLLLLGIVCADAAGKKHEINEKLDKAVSELTFHIDINTILPQGAQAIYDGSTYYLDVREGHVTSYLPFIGRSLSSLAPGENLSLSFDESPEIRVEAPKSRKKDGYKLYFTAKTESRHKWHVCITLFDNGTSGIDCISDTMSSMSYWGELDFDYKQDK